MHVAWCLWLCQWSTGSRLCLVRTLGRSIYYQNLVLCRRLQIYDLDFILWSVRPEVFKAKALKTSGLGLVLAGLGLDTVGLVNITEWRRWRRNQTPPSSSGPVVTNVIKRRWRSAGIPVPRATLVETAASQRQLKCQLPASHSVSEKKQQRYASHDKIIISFSTDLY